MGKVMQTVDAHVVIIGGGGTGAAVAHDLCLRGFRSVTLFERGELTSGTTGRHHGLLHSGARYAVVDPPVAQECIAECNILQNICSGVIERNYGLFVSLTDEDQEYERTLMQSCKDVGIPCQNLNRDKALALEPNLSSSIRSALVVPDGTFDAWRLPLQFFATAKHNGANIRPFTTVTGIVVKNGRVAELQYTDHIKSRDRKISCDVIVNAAGAWAGQVASLCGATVSVTAGAGCLLAVQERLCNMVINRSQYPGDGDIIVPQRQLSIAGTTNTKIDNPDWYEAQQAEIECLYNSAADLIPAFKKLPVHAVWTASRPLAGIKMQKARSMSRGHICIDHGKDDDVQGFISIIGGKATTLRIMAEHVVDLVCSTLGVEAECKTAEYVLRPYRDYYLEVI